MDLFELFPENLNRVLKRTADAFSVPYEGALNVVLLLACVFSPVSFVGGPGGGQIEPLVANF